MLPANNLSFCPLCGNGTINYQHIWQLKFWILNVYILLTVFCKIIFVLVPNMIETKWSTKCSWQYRHNCTNDKHTFKLQGTEKGYILLTHHTYHEYILLWNRTIVHEMNPFLVLWECSEWYNTVTVLIHIIQFNQGRTLLSKYVAMDKVSSLSIHWACRV